MAENEISDYFETDLSNTDISGITVQENVMKPSNVNNAFRAVQGALKRWFKTSLFRLRDSTDQTKLLAFDLSGLTTGTTRTVTIPNGSGTMGYIELAQTVSGVKTFSAIPILSGGGITFPGAQVASAGANTLDDYEEGTFTPVVSGSTIAGTASYSTASGRYTKVGNLVTFNFFVIYTGHTGTGNMRLTALPFTVGADPTALSVWMSSLTFSGQLVGLASNGSAEIILYNAASGVGVTVVGMDAAASILVSGFYYV